MNFLERAPRNLFFTGKGGVGKTSVACATAVALAERERRVLLVSTDPASNLDEVLETSLGSEARSIAGVPGLFALNIDPEAAAHAYRERVVGPYRGVLPDAAVRSIEEQLSGACTVEIAAFDEFSKLLGDERATASFDHVVFDTAPTGHTLRLLELPAAWTGFLESNVGGTSCLGPLAGLKAQQSLYDGSRKALIDGTRTALVLVSRADRSALNEAERTRRELAALLRTSGSAPEEVRRLLPRLRDPAFTKIVLVTLPEATPVHEAAALQRDLQRAEIRPFAWVINQSLVPLAVTDPVLVRRRANEARFHTEVSELSSRVAVVPWALPAAQVRLDFFAAPERPGAETRAAS